MRYRSRTVGEDLSRDVAAFVDLIGVGEYRRLHHNIAKGLNHKGFVTEIDDLRFSLELQLLNLERLRTKVAGKFSGSTEQIHEATEFVTGIGQTIPHLSVRARKKLRGQIVGGLKTNGLRSLQHEMRVAVAVSLLGCDIDLADLENDGGCDIVAQKNGVTYEIEAKSLPLFSGQPILPENADKLFLEIRRKFNGWKRRDRIPILNINLEGRLPANRVDLLNLVEVCNTVATTEKGVTLADNTIIDFMGTVPDGSPLQLSLSAKLDTLGSRIYVYFAKRHPKVIVRLQSRGRDKFVQNIVATISDSAKRQFSGTRPGVIWIHIDYVNEEMFKKLAFSRKGYSLFSIIADAVFASPKRKHITQIIFSGGTHLVKEGDFCISSVKRVVFNSPQSKFGETILFPDGRRRKTDRPIEEATAKSLLSQVRLHVVTFSGHGNELLSIYDNTLAQFGPSNEPSQRESVAIALNEKAQALTALGRRDEVIATYNDIIVRFGSAAESSLRTAVAGALIMKAVMLGNTKEAVSVYDDLLNRFATAGEPSLRRTVANALFNKGNVVGKVSGRGEDAVEIYDDMLAQFSFDSEEPIRELLGRALFNKGHVLSGLGRREQGIAAYDQVLAHLDSATAPSVCELIAMTLVNKGNILGHDGGALEIYDELLARFGSSSAPPLREQVAMALSNKGAVLSTLNRNVETIAICDDILARFSADSRLPLHVVVSKALVGKGTALGKLGRPTEAIAVYDETLARFGSADEPALRERVAAALCKKAGELDSLERREDVIGVCDEMLYRFGFDDDPNIRAYLGMALLNKGIMLGALDRLEDAILVYSDVITKFGYATEPLLREHTARALANQAAALVELGRDKDAIAVCDDLLVRFSDIKEMPPLELVAIGLFNKGVALRNLEASTAAIDVLNDILARPEMASEPALSGLIANAKALQGGLEDLDLTHPSPS